MIGEQENVHGTEGVVESENQKDGMPLDKHCHEKNDFEQEIKDVLKK